MVNHLPLMARFNQWVNERFYDQVAKLSDQDYRLDRKAFFGSIHNTLNHLLVVDKLWAGRITGVDSGIRALDQVLYDDFDALREARISEDSSLIDLIDGLDQDGLTREFVYKSVSRGFEHRARVDQALVTLFNHQTHHRGQVHAMLTQAGVYPPDLDIIDYLDEISEPG